MTDEEVLAWARAVWPWKFGNRKKLLWWLNPGGTLFRSENAEKIERRVRGEES